MHVSLFQTKVYEDCACIGNSTVIAGMCEHACDTQFYMYTGAMLFMALTSSLGRVPGTIVQFR